MPGRAERDDIADRRNARHVRPVQRVDLDVALLELQPDALGVEPGRHRAAAGRHEQIVGAKRLRACRRRAAPRCPRRRRSPCALVTFAPVCDVMPCLRNDFSSSADTASSSTGTSRGSSSRIVTSLPNRRKIDANSTPTAPLPMIAIDFGTSLRWIASSLVMMRLRSISMPGTLRGAEPVATMISLRRAQRLRVAFEDVDAAVAGQPRRALDPVDLVLLEQELDALGQAGDDPVLARLHLRHVDADRPAWPSADRDAPLLRVLDDLQRVRVLEQRLGRNAAPEQAGAAERLLLLDDGDLEAELRGADRRDVAAGAGADHDDVVFVGHVCHALRVSCRFSDDSGTKCGRGRARRRRRRRASRERRRPARAGSTRALQLPVLVPQLPVRLGQPLEPPGERAARAGTRRARRERPRPVSNATVRSTKLVPYRTACNSVNRLPQYRRPAVRSR